MTTLSTLQAADASLRAGFDHEISEISELSLLPRLVKHRIFRGLRFGHLDALVKAKGKDAMTLRIDISDERDRIVFTLTGRMQAEQVSELQALFQAELPDHNLVLDLREVKLVDRDAVRFLGQIEAQGARLRNCSAFIREWISQERNEMKRAQIEREKAEHQQL